MDMRGASSVAIPQTIAGSISAPVPFLFPRSRGSWCMKGTNEWILLFQMGFSGSFDASDLSDVGSFILIRIIPKERTPRKPGTPEILEWYCAPNKKPIRSLCFACMFFFLFLFLFFFFVSLVTTCWSFLKYCSFSKASLISVLLAAFIVLCTVELHNLVCNIMGMYSWGVMKFNKFGLSLCGFQIFPGVVHFHENSKQCSHDYILRC